MLIHKFDYLPIDRSEGPHGRMYNVFGKPLPSVTTILSKTKDMSHLNDWVDRVGVVTAERIRDEAAALGSGMHENLERHILDKPLTGSYMAKALANVIIKSGLCNVDEIWGSEVALYVKDLYAGTTDIVGQYRGIPSIIDFKNSIREKQKDWIEDYFMQLAAYAMAHNEMFGTDINQGVIMLATRDAKYQEFIINGDEFTHYQTMWANKVCDYYAQYGSN